MNIAPTQPAISQTQAPKQGEKAVRASAEEFEAVFLAEMMRHMFAGVETDATSENKEDEDIYRSMMAEEYGKAIAKSGGIGVADYVAREMLALQEVP